MLCCSKWVAFIGCFLLSSETGISETLGHASDLAGSKFSPIQFLPLPLAPTSLLPLPLLGFCIISVSGFLLHGTSQSKSDSGPVKQRQDFIHLAHGLLGSWLETAPGPGAEHRDLCKLRSLLVLPAVCHQGTVLSQDPSLLTGQYISLI